MVPAEDHAQNTSVAECALSAAINVFILSVDPPAAAHRKPLQKKKADKGDCSVFAFPLLCWGRNGVSLVLTRRTAGITPGPRASYNVSKRM